MSKTQFAGDYTICFISTRTREGIDGLVACIDRLASPPPKRDISGPTHVAFDHCFTLKGQGTIFTGTVVSGRIKRGDRVFLPETGEAAEVRSLQAYRLPTEEARQGDRVGICIPGINSSGKDRGDISNKELLCSKRWAGCNHNCHRQSFIIQSVTWTSILCK